MRSGSGIFVTNYNKFMGNIQFLSPPVLMHGGLLCVAFCPSVCLVNCFAISLTFDLEVKGHIGRGQRSHGSRWAHHNVKLLYFLHGPDIRDGQLGCPIDKIFKPLLILM